MKGRFEHRYLLYFFKRTQGQEGLTLIELLVVIAIISILTTIAVPSYIRQTSRARTTEGITNVAAINRYQFFFYQRQARFATDLNDLDIKVNSKYYQYVIDNPTLTYAGVKTVNVWTNIKAVSGAVLTEGGAMRSLVCVSDLEFDSGFTSVAPALAPLASLTCPSSYDELGK